MVNAFPTGLNRGPHIGTSFSFQMANPVRNRLANYHTAMQLERQDTGPLSFFPACHAVFMFLCGR